MGVRCIEGDGGVSGPWKAGMWMLILTLGMLGRVARGYEAACLCGFLDFGIVSVSEYVEPVVGYAGYMLGVWYGV